MYTLSELQDIQNSLEMALASSKRALNSSKNQAFIPIHEQVIKDLQALQAKTYNLIQTAKIAKK
jgi:hypothetical protein